MYMKKIFWILTSVLLLASCEKQSELVTIMEIDNVKWQKEYIPSGTDLHFSIDAESQHSTIQRIIITASDIEFRDRVILDSVFTMPIKKAKISYYYPLPYYKETTSVKFNGSAYDAAGRVNSFPITVNVAAGAAPLRPIDAITLYSAASGGKSAFSLTTMQPEYLGADSTAVAWFDMLNETADPDALSCAWHSETEIRFSRAEGLNYAEATAQSLAETWKNLTGSTTIKNLKADDILLFGKQDNVLGAIKILSVHDEPGTASDRYIFSLKAIQK